MAIKANRKGKPLQIYLSDEQRLVLAEMGGTVTAAIKAAIEAAVAAHKLGGVAADPPGRTGGRGKTAKVERLEPVLVAPVRTAKAAAPAPMTQKEIDNIRDPIARMKANAAAKRQRGLASAPNLRNVYPAPDSLRVAPHQQAEPESNAPPLPPLQRARAALVAAETAGSLATGDVVGVAPLDE